MNILTRQVVEEARKYIGHEETGTNDSPLIRVWLHRVRIEVPSNWCAAFAWCMLDDACTVVGVKNPIRPTASIHSFARLAKKAGLWTLDPSPGCIIFHNSGKGRGHGGIVEAKNHEETWEEGKMLSSSESLFTIEGNTNAAGSSNGRWCVRKLREMDYPNLGCLDPSRLLKSGIVNP